MNQLAQLSGVGLRNVVWIGVNCRDDEDVLFVVALASACKVADARSDAKY